MAGFKRKSQIRVFGVTRQMRANLRETNARVRPELGVARVNEDVPRNGRTGG